MDRGVRDDEGAGHSLGGGSGAGSDGGAGRATASSASRSSNDGSETQRHQARDAHGVDSSHVETTYSGDKSPSSRYSDAAGSLTSPASSPVSTSSDARAFTAAAGEGRVISGDSRSKRRSSGRGSSHSAAGRRRKVRRGGGVGKRTPGRPSRSSAAAVEAHDADNGSRRSHHDARGGSGSRDYGHSGKRRSDGDRRHDHSHRDHTAPESHRSSRRSQGSKARGGGHRESRGRERTVSPSHYKPSAGRGHRGSESPLNRVQEQPFGEAVRRSFADAALDDTAPFGTAGATFSAHRIPGVGGFSGAAGPSGLTPAGVAAAAAAQRASPGFPISPSGAYGGGAYRPTPSPTRLPDRVTVGSPTTAGAAWSPGLAGIGAAGAPAVAAATAARLAAERSPFRNATASPVPLSGSVVARSADVLAAELEACKREALAEAARARTLAAQLEETSATVAAFEESDAKRWKEIDEMRRTLAEVTRTAEERRDTDAASIDELRRRLAKERARGDRHSSRVKELEAEAVVRESRIRELHAELQKTKGAAAEGSAAGEQRMRELRREWEDAMRRVNAEQDDLTARNTELEREVQELRSELESAKKRSDYDASKIRALERHAEVAPKLRRKLEDKEADAASQRAREAAAQKQIAELQRLLGIAREKASSNKLRAKEALRSAREARKEWRMANKARNKAAAALEAATRAHRDTLAQLNDRARRTVAAERAMREAAEARLSRSAHALAALRNALSSTTGGTGTRHRQDTVDALALAAAEEDDRANERDAVVGKWVRELTEGGGEDVLLGGDAAAWDDPAQLAAAAAAAAASAITVKRARGANLRKPASSGGLSESSEEWTSEDVSDSSSSGPHVAWRDVSRSRTPSRSPQPSARRRRYHRRHRRHHQTSSRSATLPWTLDRQPLPSEKRADVAEVSPPRAPDRVSPPRQRRILKDTGKRRDRRRSADDRTRRSRQYRAQHGLSSMALRDELADEWA